MASFVLLLTFYLEIVAKRHFHIVILRGTFLIYSFLKLCTTTDGGEYYQQFIQIPHVWQYYCTLNLYKYHTYPPVIVK